MTDKTVQKEERDEVLKYLCIYYTFFNRFYEEFSHAGWYSKKHYSDVLDDIWAWVEEIFGVDETYKAKTLYEYTVENYVIESVLLFLKKGLKQYLCNPHATPMYISIFFIPEYLRTIQKLDAIEDIIEGKLSLEDYLT